MGWYMMIDEDGDGDDDDDDDDDAADGGGDDGAARAAPGSLQGLNVNLVFTTFIVVFGSSFQFGYNIGVLNQVDEVSSSLVLIDPCQIRYDTIRYDTLYLRAPKNRRIQYIE